MAEEPINLVLEHLRFIRAEITGLRDDNREIKARLNRIEVQISHLVRDRGGDMEDQARLEARLDRFGERLERIERRLDITDAK